MAFRALIVLVGLLSGIASASAQSSVPVRFEPGNFGTMVEGTVNGPSYTDYTLRARAGQEMFAELTVADSTGFGSAYFNVLPPGSTGVAIFIGSVEGRTARITLPEGGIYTIRVYLMGNDRDTGARVDFNLDLSIQ